MKEKLDVLEKKEAIGAKDLQHLTRATDTNISKKVIEETVNFFKETETESPTLKSGSPRIEAIHVDNPEALGLKIDHSSDNFPAKAHQELVAKKWEDDHTEDYSSLHKTMLTGTDVKIKGFENGKPKNHTAEEFTWNRKEILENNRSNFTRMRELLKKHMGTIHTWPEAEQNRAKNLKAIIDYHLDSARGPLK